MAMAATFMMKLVMTRSKKAIPRIKTSLGAFRNMVSQWMGLHSAALVFQRQKPMDMAPPKATGCSREWSPNPLELVRFPTLMINRPDRLRAFQKGNAEATLTMLP
jgi:hypothetical protein